MEDHIDDARIIFPALGHKLFEPITKPESKEDPDNEPLLHMEYNGYKATGKRTNEGFVILKGSAVNPNLNKSCPANVIRFREKYGNQIDKATCTLTETILLSSPSAAAGFIGGCSLSGNILWKDEKGTSLKNWNSLLFRRSRFCYNFRTIKKAAPSKTVLPFLLSDSEDCTEWFTCPQNNSARC